MYETHQCRRMAYHLYLDGQAIPCVMVPGASFCDICEESAKDIVSTPYKSTVPEKFSPPKRSFDLFDPPTPPRIDLREMFRGLKRTRSSLESTLSADSSTSKRVRFSDTPLLQGYLCYRFIFRIISNIMFFRNSVLKSMETRTPVSSNQTLVCSAWTPRSSSEFPTPISSSRTPVSTSRTPVSTSRTPIPSNPKLGTSYQSRVVAHKPCYPAGIQAQHHQLDAQDRESDYKINFVNYESKIYF